MLWVLNGCHQAFAIYICLLLGRPDARLMLVSFCITVAPNHPNDILTSTSRLAVIVDIGALEPVVLATFVSSII